MAICVLKPVTHQSQTSACYAVLVAEAVRVAGRWRSLRSGWQSWHGLLLHTCLLALQKLARCWWSCWEMFSVLIWRWSAPDAQGYPGATVPFFLGPCRVKERSRGEGESLGTAGEFLKCNSWYESKYFRLFQILCSQSSVNASVFEIWNWSNTAGLRCANSSGVVWELVLKVCLGQQGKEW